MNAIRVDGQEMRKRLMGCRRGDLHAVAQLTGVPVVNLQMWHHWAQMRRMMGTFFCALGIFTAIIALGSLPLWEVALARVLAVVVVLVGALVAGSSLRHVDASIVDYFPADACRLRVAPRPVARPVQPVFSARGSY